MENPKSDSKNPNSETEGRDGAGKPRTPISDPKSVIAATHDTNEATAHEPPPFDRSQAREKIQR